MKLRNCQIAKCTLSLATAVLSGCSDANVDLQRQITVLRDELERVKKEKSSPAAAPTGKDPERSPSAAVTDAQTLSANYEASARALRAELEKSLSDVRLESFTLYQPKFEPHPYKSEFAMEFRSAGIKFTIDHIPVKASVSGEWIFPSAESVMAQVERLKNTTAAERQAAPSSPTSQMPLRSGQSAQTTVAAPAAANKTVVVGWDSKPANAQPQGTSVNSEPNGMSRPAPTSSASGQQGQPASDSSHPSSMMPVQREVQIKF